ncbi:MAG: hypothetical protein OXL37_08280 [Chloroflexota bacterium]|nr:hypothetical protein [Chloroflexota bacterium]MDE2959650.1 hypothetical protein [Chloroflexota bacterium]
MPSPSKALRLLLAATRAIQHAGYTDEYITELRSEPLTHLQGDGQKPCAFGRCTQRGRVMVGWSAYQWSTLVREPCPRRGKPW